MVQAMSSSAVKLWSGCETVPVVAVGMVVYRVDEVLAEVVPSAAVALDEQNRDAAVALPGGVEDRGAV